MFQSRFFHGESTNSIILPRPQTRVLIPPLVEVGVFRELVC